MVRKEIILNFAFLMILKFVSRLWSPGLQNFITPRIFEHSHSVVPQLNKYLKFTAFRAIILHSVQSFLSHPPNGPKF